MESCLIKKTIIINEKFKNILNGDKIISDLKKGSDNFVLDHALQKRITIFKEYKKNKDPLNLFKRKLIEENVLSEERASEIDKLAKEEANASAEFASESPFPDAGELMDDIYWETDNPDQRSSEGRIFFEEP